MDFILQDKLFFESYVKNVATKHLLIETEFDNYLVAICSQIIHCSSPEDAINCYKNYINSLAPHYQQTNDASLRNTYVATLLEDIQIKMGRLTINCEWEKWESTYCATKTIHLNLNEARANLRPSELAILSPGDNNRTSNVMVDGLNFFALLLKVINNPINCDIMVDTERNSQMHQFGDIQEIERCFNLIPQFFDTIFNCPSKIFFVMKHISDRKIMSAFVDLYKNDLMNLKNGYRHSYNLCVTQQSYRGDGECDDRLTAKLAIFIKYTYATEPIYIFTNDKYASMGRRWKCNNRFDFYRSYKNECGNISHLKLDFDELEESENIPVKLESLCTIPIIRMRVICCAGSTDGFDYSSTSTSTGTANQKVNDISIICSTYYYTNRF